MMRRTCFFHVATMIGLGLLMGLGLGSSAVAQDAETKTIEARGLRFEVPSAWREVRPSSSMRAAQIEIGPAEGDEEPAELVLFAFPGGAGGVEANVERWERQFVDEDGQPVEAKTETIENKATEVVFVEAAGRYVAAVRPGSPQRLNKPGYRLLGGIALTPEVGYFFKLVGPDKTIKEARPGFKSMLESLKLQ